MIYVSHINNEENHLQVHETIDEFGEDGWELVSVCQSDKKQTFYFKREIVDENEL